MSGRGVSSPFDVLTCGVGRAGLQHFTHELVFVNRLPPCCAVSCLQKNNQLSRPVALRLMVPNFHMEDPGTLSCLVGQLPTCLHLARTLQDVTYFCHSVLGWSPLLQHDSQF